MIGLTVKIKGNVMNTIQTL